MLKQVKFITTICGALLAGSVSANSLIFSDNFDANALGLNTTPTGWTVSSGTVDTIGNNPSFYDLLPGNGRYIDLDGSTSNAGVLSKTFSLTAGQSYIATFNLAGNQRNAGNDIVDVTFGTLTNSYTFSSTDLFSSYSLLFSPITSGNYDLSFSNQGGDDMGALLDNVSISNVNAVPVPAAVWLFGSGLVGLIATRRKKASLAA